MLTVKLVVLAAIFVLTGGGLFSKIFDNHKGLKISAGLIAIISSYYLISGIVDDISEITIVEVEKGLQKDLLKKPFSAGDQRIKEYELLRKQQNLSAEIENLERKLEQEILGNVENNRAREQSQVIAEAKQKEMEEKLREIAKKQRIEESRVKAEITQRKKEKEEKKLREIRESRVREEEKIAKIASKKLNSRRVNYINKNIQVASQDNQDIILSATIQFEPNQSTFREAKYRDKFRQILNAASNQKHPEILIKAHGDVTLMLRQVVEAGLYKGIIVRKGRGKSSVYSLHGRSFDLTNTDQVIKEIESGTFGNSSKRNPIDTLLGLDNLSLDRANSVKNAIINFAKNNNFNLDLHSISTAGIGGRDPLVPKPTSTSEARKNMRIEIVVYNRY